MVAAGADGGSQPLNGSENRAMNIPPNVHVYIDAGDGEETEITEMTEFEAERVDGVKGPANGVPFLVLKSAATGEAAKAAAPQRDAEPARHTRGVSPLEAAAGTTVDPAANRQQAIKSLTTMFEVREAAREVAAVEARGDVEGRASKSGDPDPVGDLSAFYSAVRRRLVARALGVDDQGR